MWGKATSRYLDVALQVSRRSCRCLGDSPAWRLRASIPAVRGIRAVRYPKMRLVLWASSVPGSSLLRMDKWAESITEHFDHAIGNVSSALRTDTSRYLHDVIANGVGRYLALL